MNPALRGYILSLPLDVRRELLKCDGPGWFVACSKMCLLSLEPPGDVDDDADPRWRSAWLPISPIAIVLHAAKLLGAFEATITVDTGGGYTYANATTTPSEGEEVPYQFADVESDPTGHRAAIALLQKVMEAKAS